MRQLGDVWDSYIWKLFVASRLLVNCLCFGNAIVIPCAVVDTEQLSASEMLVKAPRKHAYCSGKGGNYLQDKSIKKKNPISGAHNNIQFIQNLSLLHKGVGSFFATVIHRLYTHFLRKCLEFVAFFFTF